MKHGALVREVVEATGPAQENEQPSDPEGHRTLLEQRAPSIARALAGSAVVAAGSAVVAAGSAVVAAATRRPPPEGLRWPR